MEEREIFLCLEQKLKTIYAECVVASFLERNEFEFHFHPIFSIQLLIGALLFVVVKLLTVY